MSILHSIYDIIDTSYHLRASDIHIVCGIPIRIRVDGRLQNFDSNVMTAEDCEHYARVLTDHYEDIAEIGELDFAFSSRDNTRCRVNLFRQQGHVSAAIRILNNRIPSFEELGLPNPVADFTRFNQGIVLVTGETGSGKSTTLACLMEQLNHTQNKHIVTLEDPIEYIYSPDKCIINQREIGRDTRSYQDGLRSVLREDPDVIFVGELRNLETIETALIAAETGHLVFATLHTNSAAETVNRIVDVFPAIQQPQIRMQLSLSLQAVICQQLLPHMSGFGRVLATEIMIANNAVRNLIREGKTPQISNVIATSAKEGCHLMDTSLIDLYRLRKISGDVAIQHAHDPEYVRRQTIF